MENKINTISQEPFVKSIVNGGGNPVVVGGSVRDELLNKHPKDLDIMVSGLTIEQLLNALKPYGTVNLVGQSFGVIKFKPTGETEDIDIALARTDKKIGVGHKGIEVNSDPSISIEDDLSRRDITINAIAKDVSGNLIDPFGGIGDLQNKIIKMVSPDAFIDDPLRMMRAIQQAARFNFTIEPNTFNTIKQNAEKINEISPDRIIEELEKIVTKNGDKEYGVELLVQTGLYQQMFGKNIEPSRIESRDWNSVRTVGEYFFLMSYGIVDNVAEFFKKFTKAMGDNKIYDEIKALEIGFNGTSQKSTMDAVETRSIAHNMYLVSPVAMESRLLPDFLINACQDLLSGKYPRTVNDLAIDGNDIMAAGLKGKPVGDMQKSLLIQIYADKLKNDRDTLLQAIRIKQPPAVNINETRHHFDVNNIINNIDFGSFDDLYPDYSRPIESDDDFMFDSKKAFDDYINDIIEMFSSFPESFAVYRAIRAKSIDDIYKDDLGESWSFDLESAKEFGSHNGSNFIISGIVHNNNINWNSSIYQYIAFSTGDADDENEIVVIDTNKLEKISITPIKQAKEIAPNPIFTRIPNTTIPEKLNERKESKYKNAKKSLFASKSISKEMKEVIAKYITGGSTYHEGGRLHGLMKPKEFTEKTPKSSGVSLGADKNGFFCYTHRCASKRYDSPSKIPKSVIEFVESTG